MGEQERTDWSLDLLMVRDIPVRIHYSFFLLPLYILLSAESDGPGVLTETALLVLMFLCIALHELGHAFAARACNIETRNITLYPFGGIAEITGRPGPGAELFIAVAGPLVNIFIALALFPFTSLSPYAAGFPGQNMITQLFLGNIILVIFNAIPALPMDGGRMLRSALNLIGVSRATIISARISQILSALIILFALYFSQAILTIIGILVFTQASQELMREKTSRAIAGLRVRDIMIDRVNIETLSHGMSVADAVTCIMKSFQDYFPVIHGNAVVGIVNREDLIRAAGSGGNRNYIAEFMQRDLVTVGPDDLLSDIAVNLSLRTGYPILVHDQEGFAGLLLQDAIAELLFLERLPQ